MKRIAIIWGVLTLVAVAIAACSGGDGSSDSSSGAAIPTAQSEPEPSLPLSATGEQIVATVNGLEITLAAFEREFEQIRLRTESATYDALATAALNTRIEQALIAQAAVELQITVTEEEIDAELLDFKSFVPDEQSWQSWLAENHYTDESFRESLRESLLTTRVRDAVTQVDSDVAVEQVRARHILVETVEEANAILARLNNGEDFAALAASFSRDVTTRDQGGDLGWFIREDLLTPELADVALALTPGERAGPISTMLGYHIIETLERGQRAIADNEQPVIAETQFNIWLQSRFESAVIERFIN